MSSASFRAQFALDLKQFTGSETFYLHPLCANFVYSEGVRFLAKTGSAYWLLDAIFAPQAHIPALATAEFQVWTLRVLTDRSAILICTDGDDVELHCQSIPWTDFPLDSAVLWFANRTLYLPSEH